MEKHDHGMYRQISRKLTHQLAQSKNLDEVEKNLAKAKNISTRFENKNCAKTQKSPLLKVQRACFVIAAPTELLIALLYWAFGAQDSIAAFPDTCYVQFFCWLSSITFHGIILIPCFQTIVAWQRLRLYKEDAWIILVFMICYSTILISVSNYYLEIYPFLSFTSIYGYLSLGLAICIEIGFFLLIKYITELIHKKDMEKRRIKRERILKIFEKFGILKKFSEKLKSRRNSNASTNLEDKMKIDLDLKTIMKGGNKN